MLKYCESCAILDPKTNICRLTGQVMANRDYCSKHKTRVETCELCHRPTLNTFFVRDGKNWHSFCGECVKQLNTCSFCKKVNVCDFETNPSSLPKMVQQQIRQGNMISVMTVRNPERIRQTCEKGCDCFSTKFGCMREFYYCERMDYVYDDQRNDASEGSEVHSEIHEQQPETGSN